MSQSDWGELMAVRVEAERAPAVLPVLRHRPGDAPRVPSARAVARRRRPV